jgi:hypothetical protein
MFEVLWPYLHGLSQWKWELLVQLAPGLPADVSRRIVSRSVDRPARRRTMDAFIQPLSPGVIGIRVNGLGVSGDSGRRYAFEARRYASNAEGLRVPPISVFAATLPSSVTLRALATAVAMSVCSFSTSPRSRS